MWAALEARGATRTFDVTASTPTLPDGVPQVFKGKAERDARAFQRPGANSLRSGSWHIVLNIASCPPVFCFCQTHLLIAIPAARARTEAGVIDCDVFTLKDACRHATHGRGTPIYHKVRTQAATRPSIYIWHSRWLRGFLLPHLAVPPRPVAHRRARPGRWHAAPCWCADRCCAWCVHWRALPPR